VELVAGAGQTSEPHALEAVVGFEMGEAHLNALSFVSRSGERLCLHLPPCDIAGILVEIAWDFATRRRMVQHFALIGHTSQSRLEAR
jgi:hypothetical protein